jgi:hypothetical protein
VSDGDDNERLSGGGGRYRIRHVTHLYPVHRDHYNKQGPLLHQTQKSFSVLHSRLQSELDKVVVDRHGFLVLTM